MNKGLIFSIIVIVLTSVSCGQRQDNAFEQRPFPQVSVPSMMTDGQEAASFLAEYFWDEFTDTEKLYPCDTALVNGVKKTELEQAYANWTAILDMVPHAEAVSAVERLFSRVSAMESKDTSSTVFEVITDMTQKYLYDPNSPFRNEDFYLPFVKGLSQSPYVPEEMKPGYEYDARMCALNQVGTKAADFVFCDRNGRRYSLYGIDADHVILFFSNPGCHACKDIIDVLSGDPGISAAVKAGKLAVLNIYIDSDLTEWYRYMPVYPDDWYNGYDPNLVIRNDMLYNIRAIPSLYLLDEDKRVILKDAPQETVFAWLANNI